MPSEPRQLPSKPFRPRWMDLGYHFGPSVIKSPALRARRICIQNEVTEPSKQVREYLGDTIEPALGGVLKVDSPHHPCCQQSKRSLHRNRAGESWITAYVRDPFVANAETRLWPHSIESPLLTSSVRHGPRRGFRFPPCLSHAI